MLTKAIKLIEQVTRRSNAMTRSAISGPFKNRIKIIRTERISKGSKKYDMYVSKFILLFPIYVFQIHFLCFSQIYPGPLYSLNICKGLFGFLKRRCSMFPASRIPDWSKK